MKIAPIQKGTTNLYKLASESIFHKKNQEIYKDFEYTGRNELVLLAKMKLGRLTEEDISEYGWLLERWGYEDKSR
ncbi:hypothetical protein [Paenibacillus sp. Soil787]|uniref:hypothetical protein n=1 Tax=Paenibacillus sp. Soil787 TaxID=1736411 RepID=UPI0012E35D0E|nr:hypothetical protein [Paenibacillus sp. Soil787]